MRCGLVGLPNAGKSTLFNVLVASQQAQVGDYPFCTINPNHGYAVLEDARLQKVAQLAGSHRVEPARLEVVDIAGLVKGASRGEGLGNRFLSHIRECEALLHVVDCFRDGTDSVGSVELVETELILADIQSLERQLTALERKSRGGDRDLLSRLEGGRALLEFLSTGCGARLFAGGVWGREFQLLSAKPVIYVLNVGEGEVSSGNAASAAMVQWSSSGGGGCVLVSARLEAELMSLDAQEALAFRDELGLSVSGLARVAAEGFRVLGLINFFTAGLKEARAWTVLGGSVACEAAGVIHSDFARGFICAEVVDWESYVSCGGRAGAAERGLLRQEGRDYVVQDADIIEFRFNV